MKPIAGIVSVMCCCLTLYAQEASLGPTASQQVAESGGPINPEEAAIRKTLASYVEAFNQGDARALASHWNEHGEYVPPRGEAIQGHEKLEEAFANYFNESNGA